MNMRLITKSWRLADARRRRITIIIEINITKGLIIIENTPRNIISIITYNSPVVDPLPENKLVFFFLFN